MRILVTGAGGFIGENLCGRLRRDPDSHVIGVDVADGDSGLEAPIREGVDLIFHLAGVNRPREESEFREGNVLLTERVLNAAREAGSPFVVFSSSIQAELNNPYGRSKREAEDLVNRYARQTGGRAVVYRLPNVFGKWSRPQYNSVVATFCDNLVRGVNLRIDDTDKELTFVYIDDVVREFARHAGAAQQSSGQRSGPLSVFPQYRIAVGALASLLTSFRDSRETGILPGFSDPLSRYLYATYLSFLPTADLARSLNVKTDHRGWLAEFLKSESFGQVFISVTNPGVTRGNHFHDTKVEKFCVVRGDALIRLRSLRDGSTVEYPVSGSRPLVVDIPPGCVHSITNVGEGELVTLFWADEIFDPQRADTYAGEAGT
jgi:UDP-2-acetamido-2,6-beta-L-arabino-hexul-4-ose reductase